MNIYIISYLGGTLREKRKELHSKQLDYFAEFMPNSKITILSQAYEPDDYRDGITYIDSEPVSPSIARNKLLKIFYATTDNFAVFADDDCVLDQRYCGGSKVLDDIETRPEYLYFDFIGLLHGRFSPTNAFYYDEKDLHDTCNVFAPVKGIKTSFCIQKNFKHINNEEYYYDENLKELEDHEYSVRLRENGKKIYICHNLVSIDYGLVHSTLMVTLGREPSFDSRNSTDVFKNVIKDINKAPTKLPRVAIKRSYKAIHDITCEKKNGRRIFTVNAENYKEEAVVLPYDNPVTKLKGFVPVGKTKEDIGLFNNLFDTSGMTTDKFVRT